VSLCLPNHSIDFGLGWLGSAILALGMSAAPILADGCVSPPSGIMAWWPGDGGPKDLVGGYNAGLENGATTDGVGFVNQAFQFDGVNALAYVYPPPDPNPTHLGLTKLTLMAWVHFDSLDSFQASEPGLQYLVFKSNGRIDFYDGYALRKIRFQGQDYMSFLVSSASGEQVITRSLTPVTTNQFYHVAGVFDGVAARLYINGSLENEKPVFFELAYDDSFLAFGSSARTYDGHLQGELDEVAMWNRALSSNEVASIFTAANAGMCNGVQITAPPQNQTVVAGSNATFTVGAKGRPLLTYNWLFQGTNLAGATNASLILGNIQPGNAGAYSVVVSNPQGATTSAVAVLTVNFSLTVNANGDGSVSRNPNAPSYPANTDVSLTATPEPGTIFVNWSGDSIGTSNRLTVTMTSNKVITANFASTALTIITQGVGTIAKLPDLPFYDAAQQVSLTATPARWFAFTGWGDSVRTNPRIITIGPTNVYTAIFSPTTAVETLEFNGISRTAPIGMPALFVDGEFVVTNAVFRLGIAEIAMQSTFPNGSIFYTLDGATPNFGANLYAGGFVLHRSATVRAVAYDANFVTAWELDPVPVVVNPTFLVNVTTPGGGTVAVSPPTASYRSNTLVSLTALPAPGWTFLQWLGDVSGAGAMTNVVVRNRDLCVQALFGTGLSTVLGGNGTVTIDPSVPFYPYGTVVRLTAMPAPGNYFGAWGNAASSTANPLRFLVTNANATVSCIFGSLSPGQVALILEVDGGGRVTIKPPGNRFDSGQLITLSAVPDQDQEFVGWSGDASGNSTNISVELTQTRVLVAHFTKHARLVLGPCLGAWGEGGFRLTLNGELGGRYRIEGSSSLANWSVIDVFTNAFGLWQTIDPASTSSPERFYRALEEP